MALPITRSLLVITPLSGYETPQLAPYSARGLTQTYSLIPTRALERTTNGGLLDLSAPQFQKYITEITCTSPEVPALGGAFRGVPVEIQCVAELGWPTGGPAPRPMVAGSERVNGDFTFGRPILQARLDDLEFGKDEWAGKYNWRMRFLEDE